MHQFHKHSVARQLQASITYVGIYLYNKAANIQVEKLFKKRKEIRHCKIFMNHFFYQAVHMFMFAVNLNGLTCKFLRFDTLWELATTSGH